MNNLICREKLFSFSRIYSNWIRASWSRFLNSFLLLWKYPSFSGVHAQIYEFIVSYSERQEIIKFISIKRKSSIQWSWKWYFLLIVGEMSCWSHCLFSWLGLSLWELGACFRDQPLWSPFIIIWQWNNHIKFNFCVKINSNPPPYVLATESPLATHTKNPYLPKKNPE